MVRRQASTLVEKPLMENFFHRKGVVYTSFVLNLGEEYHVWV